MTRNLRSMSDTLFYTFADPEYTDPQQESQMWAIEEGLRRIDPLSNNWRSIRARKDHVCMRDCHIESHNTYYKRMIGAGWGNDWKFCASCMAMILYFKNAHKLPPVAFSHWDVIAKEPVRIEPPPKQSIEHGGQFVKYLINRQVAREVDAKSEELIQEFSEHYEEFIEVYPDRTDKRKVFEGWVIQKIAGIQLVVLDLQGELIKLRSQEATEGDSETQV